MAKEMKVWELLELLSRNHKEMVGKKFKCIEDATFSVTCDPHPYEIVVCDINGKQVLKHISEHGSDSGYIDYFNGTEVIEPVEIPVTFLEAVNSGGKIRPECGSNYLGFSYWMTYICGRTDDKAKEIINGKWYIE